MSVSDKIRRDLDLLFENKEETKIALDEGDCECTKLLQQALGALKKSSPELAKKIEAHLQKDSIEEAKEAEVDEDEEVDEAKEEEVDEDEEKVDEEKKPKYKPQKPKNIGKTAGGSVVCKVRRRPTRRGSRKFEL